MKMCSVIEPKVTLPVTTKTFNGLETAHENCKNQKE